MMFWYGGGWPVWAGILMWVVMLVFWGLLLWGGYMLITNATRRSAPAPPGDARRFLDERLARGEIDPDQYRSMLELISAQPGTRPPGGSR
jgi:putative membrane protein